MGNYRSDDFDPERRATRPGYTGPNTNYPGAAGALGMPGNYTPPNIRPYTPQDSAPDVAPAPAPSASLTGGASPAAANGPQVGGTGGYGFTNMASYLYANPSGEGAGTGFAPTPTGFHSSDFNPQIHGYSPTAEYTAGMSGVDNGLNAAYGRVGVPAPVTHPPPGDGSTGNPSGGGAGGGGEPGGGVGGGGSGGVPHTGPGDRIPTQPNLRQQGYPPSGSTSASPSRPYNNLRSLFF